MRRRATWVLSVVVGGIAIAPAAAKPTASESDVESEPGEPEWGEPELSEPEWGEPRAREFGSDELETDESEPIENERARVAAEPTRRTPHALLVQVLRGARQALLLDRNTGEFRVVKVGDELQGFRVVDIEVDQIVLVRPSAPERAFVLPLILADDAQQAVRAANGAAADEAAIGESAPGKAGSDELTPRFDARAPSPPPRFDARAPSPTTRSSDLAIPAAPPRRPGPPASRETDVLDPYGGVSGDEVGDDAADSNRAVDGADRSAPAPFDPRRGSAEAGSVPTVIAPPASRAERDPTAVAPPASRAESGPTVIAPPASRAEPDLTVIAPPAEPDPAPGVRPGARAGDLPAAPAESRAVRAPTPRSAASAPRKLSRRELDSALADFSALARTMQIEPVDGGGIRIVELESGSFVARLGLETGDVIKRVAGHSIDTVDQAAAAYAALSRAKDVMVELERGGRPLRLRFRLTR